MYIARLLQEHKLATPVMINDFCQRTDYHEIFHIISVTYLNFELPNPKRLFTTNTHKHI